MKFITYKELNNDIVSNIYKIPNDVDLIVGIPRSGMLVATILSLYLNKPLTDIDSFLNGHIFSTGSSKNTNGLIANVADAKNVLVVDDSIAMGNAINNAKKKINNSTITAFEN